MNDRRIQECIASCRNFCVISLGEPRLLTQSAPTILAFVIEARMSASAVDQILSTTLPDTEEKKRKRINTDAVE